MDPGKDLVECQLPTYLLLVLDKLPSFSGLPFIVRLGRRPSLKMSVCAGMPGAVTMGFPSASSVPLPGSISIHACHK